MLTPFFFLVILQIYCKLVILDTLDIPGYGQQKQWYHLVQDFDGYTKNKISPLLFFGILVTY